HLAYLAHVVCVGDERFLGRGVDAEVAGMAYRRRADPQVHFGGAWATQHGHDSRSGGATHDAVVEQRGALIPQNLWKPVGLQVHPSVALLLLRLDEGATDVAVFDQPLAVRQPRRTREADGRGRSRVWHGHDEVSLDRVLAGELLAHAFARRVDQLAIYQTV